jgi:plastocyanin
MKTNIFPLFVLGLLWIIAADTSTFAIKHRIAVSDFQFTPKTIANVKIGDTILWYLATGLHTTTSDTIPAGAESWDKPISPGDTTFEYVPALTGVYKYHCTPHLSMGMVGSFTVVSASGISNTFPDASFHLYPNPVYDNLSVHMGTSGSYIRDLKIYDLGGKLIRELTFESNPGMEDRTVNISDLDPGIFLIEFLDSNNNKYSRKITKL